MSENAAGFFGRKQLICVQLPQLQQQLECVAMSFLGVWMVFWVFSCTKWVSENSLSFLCRVCKTL